MVLKANKPIQINANYRRTEKLLESGEIDVGTSYTAGDNITIENGVISADVPEPLVAGENITIEDGVISAVGGSWVPLTKEEYYDGSVWENRNLKKDILALTWRGKKWNNIDNFKSGVCSCMVPAGRYPDELSNFLIPYGTGNLSIRFERIFADSETVGVSFQIIKITRNSTDGIITISDTYTTDSYKKDPFVVTDTIGNYITLFRRS